MVNVGKQVNLVSTLRLFKFIVPQGSILPGMGTSRIDRRDVLPLGHSLKLDVVKRTGEGRRMLGGALVL